MSTKTALPADYIGNLSQLDMVLDARKVLAELGGTDAEWAANTHLINRYSKGSWTAEGKAPARRTGTPIPTDRDPHPTNPQRPRGTGTGGSRPTPASDAVTPRQRDLVTRLATKHLPPEAAASAIALCDQRTKRTISSLIGSLLDMDRANPHGNAAAPAAARKSPADLDAELPPVPTGRYTLNGEHFKIENGKGRWTGRVFIRHLDTTGHELADIRDHTRKLEIMTAVAADPHAAAVAYGKATGECGRCDTALEDPESIARGIGPYCEAKILDITVNEVYRLRKANPASAPAPIAPEPVTETPAPAAPTAPAPAAAVDGKTLDQMTFAELMIIAKQLKVPGRGTARLPQLREGVARALAAA